MKTLYKPIALLLPFLAFLVAQPLQTTCAQQDIASPTPTYDPFAEPRLPPDPTEYELGRNLYWHWCMTCHGDRGQGLTDEFRGIWDAEHQNCWGRGCHSGRDGETGFPIPTVVPALVGGDRLMQFSSQEELVDFLAATHPPQSPGILKKEEYQAIALFVLAMNGRLPAGIAKTATPAPTATQTRPPYQEAARGTFPSNLVVILALLASLAFALIVKRMHTQT